METRDEIFHRLTTEANLAGLHDQDPPSDGWEEWAKATLPSFWQRIQDAEKAVNDAYARKAFPPKYEQLVREWIGLLRAGILAFKSAARKPVHFKDGSVAIPSGGKTLVFDLETQKSAEDVGGWGNISKMLMSFGAVFHVEKNELRMYGASQVHLLIDDLVTANTVVGFNHLSFDYEVLRGYEPSAPFDKPNNFDIMVDLWAYLYTRPSLASVAEPTLGIGKSGSGLEALSWWRSGQIHNIVDYLIQDVRVTYELFLHGCTNGGIRFRPFGSKREDAIVSVPTPGWRELRQRTEWDGQVTMDGTVICPHDRKKKKSKDTRPGGRE